MATASEGPEGGVGHTVHGGFVLAIVAVPARLSLGAASMPVQQGLPLADLTYALVAPEVFVDIGRTRGVVHLVPVCLHGGLVSLLLFLLPVALGPLRPGIHPVIVVVGCPIGEGGFRRSGCSGRRIGVGRGGRRLGEADLGFLLRLLLGASYGLERLEAQSGVCGLFGGGVLLLGGIDGLARDDGGARDGSGRRVTGRVQQVGIEGQASSA